MAYEPKLIEVLKEIRGTGAPGDVPEDGIYHDIILKETDSDDVTARLGPGIYGSMQAMYTGVSEVLAISDNIETIVSIEAEIVSLYTDKNVLDSLFADKTILDSLVTDKATLDSIYADKATLDAINADLVALDAIYAKLTELLLVESNLSNIQVVVDNIVDIQNAEENALYVKEAREAMGDPTGFNLSVPDELGIIELAIENPDESTEFIIYGIDQNNDDIANRTEAKVSAVWGDGSSINSAIPYQFAQYPVDGNTPVTWWISGTKYTNDAIEVVDIVVESGKHFFYRDADGLKTTTTYNTDLLDIYAYVSALYGNADTGAKVVFANERHGIDMSGASHKLHHLTEGTEYVSGYGIVGLAESSGVYTQLDSGRYFDEDIDRITPIQTDSPFWYIVGGIWVGVTDGLNLGIVGTRTNYNENVAGTWQLTEIGAGTYCLMHIFVTNDVEFPCVKILGQNEYASVADARAGALVELQSMVLTGLPSEEYAPLYTVILDDAGDLVLTDTGDLYQDWRTVSIKAIAGSGDTLPSQAGNADKFLQTDGTIPNWVDIDAYLGTVYEGL